MQEVHHKPPEPLQQILITIKEGLRYDCENRGDCLFIPKWQMTIKPEINQLDDRMAVLYFYIFCPEWDEPLFECSAACSKDQNTAIGMALSSFVFCFLQGILAMQEDDEPDKLKSRFAGLSHRWRVYKTDSVGMGESTEDPRFWDLLKPHIEKRLGNQRLCYVKVFASKAIGQDGQQVTGEVRINDVPSPELGKLVEQVAAKWDIKQFSSQKQFFFLKQESETTLPNPYSGAEQRFTFTENTKTALEHIAKCNSQEEYDELYGTLTEKLKDITLTEEILAFLPEIAAENAFSQMQYSEQIKIAINGKEPAECYKSQLADYYPLQKTMFSLFDSGVFGDRTDDIYRKLIGCSSIYNVVRQMEDKGSKLEDCKLTSLVFNVSESFEIR